MSLKSFVLLVMSLLFLGITSVQAEIVYTEDVCEGGTPFGDNMDFRPIERGFDNSNTDFDEDAWFLSSLAGNSGGRLGYDFGEGNEKTIRKYTISITSRFGNGTPYSWEFQGSNDNTNWTILDIQTNVQWADVFETHAYEISNLAAYRYYRFYFPDDEWNGYNAEVGEVEMMEGSGSNAAVISLIPDNAAPVVGDSLCVNVDITDAAGLYSAAFDMTYDPAVLAYQSATEGNFLNADTGATFFEASLLNNDPASGIVVVGVSRVADIGAVSGSGTLATVCFNVTGGGGTNISVGIDNGYFEGTESGVSIDVTEDDDPVVPVEIGVPVNLVVTDPGTLDRLDISWDAVPGAATYEIYRADASGGAFELIGTSGTTTYQDADCILTHVSYFYTVKAVAASGSKGDMSAEASGAAAGLAGDINKDNRVDGRDLTLLARAFNSVSGDVDFDCQADLERSGVIDGDDLVVISTGFGDQL